MKDCRQRILEDIWCYVLKVVTEKRNGNSTFKEQRHICKVVWLHRLAKRSSLLSNATCNTNVCAPQLSHDAFAKSWA